MKTKDITQFLKKMGIEDFDKDKILEETHGDRRRAQQKLLTRLNKENTE